MISNEVMNGTLMEKGKVKANLDLGLLMNLHFVRLFSYQKKVKMQEKMVTLMG